MNRAEFLSEFGKLEHQIGAAVPNFGCISSTELRACGHCMFSTGLDNCFRCTHCTDCRDCSHLSHCVGCTACHQSAYLTDSRNCHNSAYLVSCVACTDCNYCFGCVGLHKKDFHILNVPYTRSEYFEMLKKLKRELGIR